MRIYHINNYTDAVYEAACRLLPQLSETVEIPTKREWEMILESPTCNLFVAENETSQIVGMISLVNYRIPTGLKIWIEDVVVDQSSRGLGLSRSMTLHAIDFAKQMGAKNIMLTSRPSRIAANKLYQSMGFELRETNVYQLDTKP
ncbi:hypothetical protein AwDysgo_06640 [Bacteroidales bacterium]|nr:hypothetical protein AwDysgo_06640 [Bacteroidales bacterium]